MRSLPLAFGLFLVGCHACPPETTDRNTFHPNPPLQTMPHVAGAINANNEKIPTLWATLNYRATVKQRDGRVTSLTSDDGRLFYMRPNRFRLIGDKEIVGRIFDLGTNEREYWFEVVPGENLMRWGTYDDLARYGTRELGIPFRPDLILEVLGVNLIDPQFLKLPAPIMRYDAATDSYVFLFAVNTVDHWFAQKEVWYERTTIRPRRVVLYDSDGRPELDAKLSNDVHVRLPDQPQERWPLIAGDYHLFVPGGGEAAGSHMELTLKDVRLSTSGPRGTSIPQPSTFEKPDVSDTDVRSMQIGGRAGE